MTPSTSAKTNAKQIVAQIVNRLRDLLIPNTFLKSSRLGADSTYFYVEHLNATRSH